MSRQLPSSEGPMEHFLERLRCVEIIKEPYPHYCLEEVFPEDFYQAMMSNLPERNAYQNLFEITTLKLDHFRYRDQRDLADDWTESLPEEQKIFWEGFNKWFHSPELAQAVLKSFAGPMNDRFGAEENWPETAVEAQLIRHEAGYFLQPHTDYHTKLVVLLFYLARDNNSQQLGTSIYLPRDPDFACHESHHHPFDEFVNVKTAAYRPNTLLAFERSDRSFHGVEPVGDEGISNGNRDLIQYVIYDKLGRQKQLRGRRLVQQRRLAQQQRLEN